MDAEGLKRLVEGVFSPFGIVTALFATGLLVCLVRRRSWLGHRLLVMGGALWLVGSFVPLADLTISRLERDYPPLVRTEGLTVETIVILSAYARDDPGFP